MSFALTLLPNPHLQLDLKVVLTLVLVKDFPCMDEEIAGNILLTEIRAAATRCNIDEDKLQEWNKLICERWKEDQTNYTRSAVHKHGAVDAQLQTTMDELIDVQNQLDHIKVWQKNDTEARKSENENIKQLLQQLMQRSSSSSSSSSNTVRDDPPPDDNTDGPPPDEPPTKRRQTSLFTFVTSRRLFYIL